MEKLTAISPDLDIRIFVDHTTEERLSEFEYVRDEYCPQAQLFHAGNHILAPSGTWNILHSLKAGYDSGAELVILVEEDVLVESNFLNWHITTQQSGDYFVTSGRKLSNRDDTYYSNPGCCFQREKLALVVPHINDEYFANPKTYLEKHFPHMDDAGVLDDGLIRRVMQSVNGRAKCAVPAICRHIGFHGYQKYHQFANSGTVQQRIDRLRMMLAEIDPNDRYTRDFES